MKATPFPTVLLSTLCLLAMPIHSVRAEERAWDNDPNGVQVFILAGQSNMVGHGKSDVGHGDVPGAVGSLRHLVENDPENYGHLVDENGEWRTRDDVKVWWRDSEVDQPRAVLKGDLRIGYSQSRNPNWIGPEYGFGWTVADHFVQPVLLVKVAWGGKSLHKDFRPPSAAAARGGEVGPYYTAMIDYVRDAVDNLGEEFPEWRGKGYRIAGVAWHQGWNDRVDAEASAAYEENLVDLIKDLREEFGQPELPFSITTTSMDPPAERTAVELAQLAVGDPQRHPQFVGNVVVTDARPFWRPASESPSNFGFHWNHNAESQYLNGRALALGMLSMLQR